MRDHVVQLTGDPEPLGCDGLCSGLRTQCRGVLAAFANRMAGHPGGGKGQDKDHDRAGEAVCPGPKACGEGDLYAERRGA
ncbi:hypothetical protein ACFQ8W_26070 [Streptomyces sp. NPDC056508]|uniref:hypothetical protein n=1 Tax=Streptomyces sp. NPDC056508 TaxID=3345845 RepID=UPI0036838BC5